ncbi:MAG TPA: extracellular solute-binding protein [Bacillales bacterium]|nr:extracellular solute-binding protein [Bacillales bacterium]
MKKLTTLLLALAVVLGLLSACGRDNSTSGKSATGDSSKDTTTQSDTSKSDKGDKITEPKPKQLLVWGDQHKEAGIKPALKSFEEKYGIKVKLKTVSIADKARQQLRLDGPAGKGPDVLTIPHDQIGQLVEQGLLMPLDVPKSMTSIFTDSSIQAETYKGKLYGLPKTVETPVLVYNKKYIKTPPQSFKDLWNLSEELKKQGKYGFLFLGDNFYFAHAYMAAYGGYVFKNNNGTLDPTDLGINNDGAVQGAEWIAKWYKSGLFPKGIVGKNGGSALDGLWTEGKVAAKNDGPWSYDSAKKAGLDFTAMALPKLPNGEYPKTFIGVKGWQVSAYTKSPQWSTKLAEWLANTENSKIRYKQTGEIPPIKSLIDDPMIKDNPLAKAVFVQAQRGEPMPNIPAMSQVWTPMANALQEIVTGKADAKSALDQAAKTIHTQIKQMNAK